MGRFFIGYRRADTQHVAGRMFDQLEAHFGEGSVFMDVASIELGRDFRHVIANAIGYCDVLLALVGSRWLAADEFGRRRIDDPDDPVRIEIETAISCGVRVVPVLSTVRRNPVSMICREA